MDNTRLLLAQADALDAFWDAAVSAARNYDDTTANAILAGIANGFAAMAGQLRQHAEKPGPKLIGWRTEDFLMETDDPNVARNLESHFRMLPIFEGDPNTKLKVPK